MKNIKLAVIFTVGLSVILILLSAAFFTISNNSIRRLGNYAVDINLENTKDISSDLFLEITKRTASQYSKYFDDAKDIAFIIAKQIEHNLSQKHLKNVCKEVELTSYKGRDFFVNKPSDGLTAYYWGNTKKVPENVTSDINAISELTPLLKNIFATANDYYFAIWIHGEDHYTCLYPPLEFYKEIETRNTFEKYFKAFNILILYPKNSPVQKTMWMKPYRDITDVTLLTAYCPVYDINGKISAFVGVDLDLGKLLGRMLTDKLLITQDEHFNKNITGFKGFLFIVGNKGTIIAFPGEYTELFSLPKNYSNLQYLSQQFETKLSDSSDPIVKLFTNEMLNNNNGIKSINLKGDNYYVGFSKIESTDWKLGFVVSEERLIAPARKTRTKMVATEKYISKHSILVTVFFLFFTILFALFFFRKFVFIPIRKIRKEVKRLGKGNFDIKVSEEGVKEIAEFASVFNYLGKELREYIENLKNEIIAREKIETEIKIAADIQMSTLPELTEEFLRKEFELSAKIIPALDASGDFYDFFYITENRIAVLIADVAGKGIPAAFYMAMSKILFKSICMQEIDDPARVMARVNKLLSQDNRSYMFLTVFLFYYDIDSGEITYANAGHHCSYLLNSKGGLMPFGLLNNMAIGFDDNAEYDSESLKLQAGEKVVLYTDGVIEASSPEGVMYGENCFEEFLKNNYSFDCQKLSDLIVNEIINFEKNKRFDDITVVVLQKNI